jgi:hypothetical protein
MLHDMARGDSGRIVLEVDPSQKDELYAAVTKNGLTLKDWFLKKAKEYLHEQKQPHLFAPYTLAESPVTYRVTRKKEAKSKAAKPKKQK